MAIIAMNFAQRHAKRVLWVCAIVAGFSVAHAITSATTTIDRIDGEGWTATGIEFEVDLAAQPMTARARIARVQFAAFKASELRNVRVECRRLALTEFEVICDAARLQGGFAELGEQSLAGRVKFSPRTDSLEFVLNNLRFASGVAQLSGEWRNSRWSARMQLRNAQADTLLSLIKKFVPASDPYSASGSLDAEATLQGQQADIARIEWRIAARQLSAANAEGTLASDALSLAASGVVTRRSKSPAWLFTVDATSKSGQAYAEPIFMDLGKHALALHAEGELPDNAELTLQKFSWQQPGVATATGTGQIVLGEPLRVDRLELDIQRVELPGAYATLAQPLLVNSALGTLQTQGFIKGRVAIRDSAPAIVALEMRNVFIADTQNRFSVDDLSGALHWRESSVASSATPSSLSWRGGQALGLDIGPAELKFLSIDRNIALLGKTRIPLLDGAIELNSFAIERAAQEDMELQLDATLQPISVQRLCAAFGWPEFGGTLGGRLTDLRLRDGVLTLGTTLEAQVFDGRVSVADLRLEKPFSNWPRFSASIDIQRVDLAQVTSAFSFGMITGLLSGEIRDLHLFNWSPVAFDAKLYTPKDDKSRHRISQNAVRNIGNLSGSGGGVAAALQTSVLRFFDDFNYDRLGISCRLRNDVCQMTGVEPAPNGYYLVKGKGVPRIDVIGNATRVDWPRMVKQLETATQTNVTIK